MTTPCSLSFPFNKPPQCNSVGVQGAAGYKLLSPPQNEDRQHPAALLMWMLRAPAVGSGSHSPPGWRWHPRGTWGWGGARSSSGAWCQPGRLTSGLPRLPKMLHPQRGSLPGNLLIWQPRAGGAPPPRPPGIPSEPGAPWSPPPRVALGHNTAGGRGG